MYIMYVCMLYSLALLALYFDNVLHDCAWLLAYTCSDILCSEKLLNVLLKCFALINCSVCLTFMLKGDIMYMFKGDMKI